VKRATAAAAVPAASTEQDVPLPLESGNQDVVGAQVEDQTLAGAPA
jgi:hypothetical protein